MGSKPQHCGRNIIFEKAKSLVMNMETLSAINIKPVSAEQLPLLLGLARSTFESAFAHMNNPEDFADYVGRFFTLQQIQQEWSNPYASFFIAWINNQPVGYLKLNTQEAQHEFKTDEGMELERIYVVPGMQQHGLGAKLLAFAERMARMAGKRYLWLGVWEKNTGAIRFYERHGFSKIGEHDFVIGTDVQRDWLMRKDLH